MGSVQNAIILQGRSLVPLGERPTFRDGGRAKLNGFTSIDDNNARAFG
jgi:hypothetical protein